MVIMNSGKTNFNNLNMLKPALLLLLFSAANVHWHVLHNVQCAQNSLSLVYLFHRRTGTAYVYNERLVWYDVVFTPRIR